MITTREGRGQGRRRVTREVDKYLKTRGDHNSHGDEKEPSYFSFPPTVIHPAPPVFSLSLSLGKVGDHMLRRMQRTSVRGKEHR